MNLELSMYSFCALKENEQQMWFQTLTLMDSEEPVQHPISLETPNNVWPEA